MSPLHCLHSLMWVKVFSLPLLFLRSFEMQIRQVLGTGTKTVERQRGILELIAVYKKGLKQ